jgi:hypothetical protein
MRHSTAALKNTPTKETYYTDEKRPTPTKETRTDQKRPTILMYAAFNFCAEEYSYIMEPNNQQRECERERESVCV